MEKRRAGTEAEDVGANSGYCYYQCDSFLPISFEFVIRNIIRHLSDNLQYTAFHSFHIQVWLHPNPILE